ncbi:hypothetical protein BDZ89DRAFT_1140754 [Hymenopellis radicata]|nr:hypothetical protein BDZ89DRAFT_1140754 [Hymenopellis radicata]
MTPAEKEEYYKYLAWKEAQDAMKAKGEAGKKRKEKSLAKKVAKSSTRRQKKRSKKNEQGGLSPDWKKTINRYQTEAAASTTSLGEVVGEFDDVESPATLSAARAGEIKGGSKRRQRNTIAIIPADVKEIGAMVFLSARYTAPATYKLLS